MSPDQNLQQKLTLNDKPFEEQMLEKTGFVLDRSLCINGYLGGTNEDNLKLREFKIMGVAVKSKKAIHILEFN
jgi:hypothetical protein